MIRFLVLFGALLLIALLMTAGMLSQNGYSLTDPAMAPMVFVSILVAGYVSWRINGILKRRDQSRGAGPDRAGGKSGGLFSSRPSAAQSARAARVAARRKKLISEGKLEAESDPEPEPEAPPEPEKAPAARVSQASPIKDRMAARAERVRQAKEQGKL
nr:hypothetical protein [uncultured Hyphomonas sp.]